MLIGARNSFGKEDIILPYDAEVEYLRTSGKNGGPYINTEVTASLGLEIGVKYLTYSTSPGWSGIVGAWGADDPTRCVSLRNGSATQLCPSYAGSSGVIRNLSSGTPHIAILTEGKCILDGVITSWTKVATNIPNIPIFAFVENNNGRPWSGRYLNGQIYSLYIKKDGHFVRDYIPVRVGEGNSSLGYLYDRVSGILFGNAGTGSFVIGPDVK